MMRSYFMAFALFRNYGKFFRFRTSEWLFTFSRYKSTMRLNITKIRPQDYGEYHCVSKNEMGIARAVFHLQGNDLSAQLKLLDDYRFSLCDRTKSLHHARLPRVIVQSRRVRRTTSREGVIRRRLWTASNMSGVSRAKVSLK